MRSESGPRLAVASILIVEDDDAIADALVILVEDAGYVALPARTLVEARAILAQERPSLILLDLTLNGEFGGDLLEELANDAESPAVIIVSAFRLATLLGQRYGVPVVPKPFAAERLEEAMRDALEAMPRPRKTG